MKQLTCEMCGSTDLLKQDGVFVCQSCGTKYSVEEAKRMMIEGTVEVQGVVKVDSSEKLKNLYQIARRARDDENSENAAKYYDLILQEDPMSWEASFYVVYYSAMQTNIANIQGAANKINNCDDTVLKLIKDTVTDSAEQQKAVSEVALRVEIISTMLFSAAKSHYDGIDAQIKSRYNQEWIKRAFACFQTMYSLGDQLEALFPEKYACDLAVTAWKTGINWHNSVIPLLSDQVGNRNSIEARAQKVAKYDSTYQAPAQPTDGCYVATAVYGSYDCPQVWTLRRYRDFTIAKNVFGRAFIRTYYAVSPTIVTLFGKTKWFTKIWRKVLDRKVEELRRTGVADTPYEDRQW